MNDSMSRVNQNPWLSPASQAACPGCSTAATPATMPSDMNMFPMSTAQFAPTQTAAPQSMMMQPFSQSALPQIMNPVPRSRQGTMQVPFGAPPPSTSNITPFEPGQISSPSVDGLSPTALPGLTAINLFNQPTAVNFESLQYLNGFLLTQIGRQVSVEFLIGSNTMVTKNGRLVGVGANYILINEYESDDIVACDFYSIKFIKFYF
ncbi:hypothetical protein [Hydrogenoanaerobacterium sp.]|uniref:hypothetical protein n=1 Tax=Hydrogenoanaerobacterium sp. TaxID=2953763 RepID=UPI00289AAD5C|nr:hypothetical protein [Hydrogenoanaerobacterium sp.]